MNGFIASLQFISTLPLGKSRPFDPRGIRIHFPLAGLAIGLMLTLFDQAASALWPDAVAAVLDVVLLAVISGAFHLDGLADMADGLYGHREHDQTLAIMKDSRVGAMGVVAVVCVLLVKTVALASLTKARFVALLIVPAYARAAMIFGMRWLPYVRGEEGTGSPFFSTPLSIADFRFVLVPVLLSLLLGWRGVLLNIFFGLGLGALILLYRRKLGGVTGDLLGAMVEIMEAILFVAVCIGGDP